MNNPKPSNPDKKTQPVPYQGTNGKPAISSHDLEAGNILPDRYPIVLDQDFWDTFAKDPVALPPAHLVIPLWRSTEGKAEFRRRQQQAAAQNNEAVLLYERLVSDIESKNQRIRCRNQEDLDAYRKEHAAYQRKVADYQKALQAHEHLKVAQRKSTEARLLLELQTSIDEQTPILREILVDIARRARRKTAISLLFCRVVRLCHALCMGHLPLSILHCSGGTSFGATVVCNT